MHQHVLDWKSLRIDGIEQFQRLLVRKKRLLHLVHDVGERDAVLRIGEGVTAARAWVPEGERRWTEQSSRCSRRIPHESGGKRSRNLENAINTERKCCSHLRDRVAFEESTALKVSA